MNRRIFVFGALAVGVVPVRGQQLLPADLAFWIRTRSIGDGLISVDFRTAPGYILYRDRFAFFVGKRELKGRYPTAHLRFDKTLNERVAYFEGDFSVELNARALARPLILSVHSQGCAVELGVCYPPVVRDFAIQV